MSENFGLSIDEAVLAKMAGMAATEVEGVASISTKVADIKGLVDHGFKGVKATVAPDGEITIDVYIVALRSANVKEVAKKVQQNVKEKLQNMTGSAVSRVNVHVEDIVLDGEEPEA